MANKLIFKIIIIFTVFFLFNSVKTANAADNYKLEIIIDPSQRTVQGTSEVNIFNNSKENFDRIFFLMGLNNSYDTKMKVTEISTGNDVILPGSFYRYRYLGKEEEDKTIYQVSLPATLNAGESITLKLKFEVANLSKVNNILFLDDNINDIYISSWYPRVINYANGNWQKRDFTTNNYEVNVIVPVDETVAASGVEIDTQTIKNKGQKKISYKVNNARGFSLASSKFIIPETEQSKDGIIIKSYYKSYKTSKWHKSVIEISKEIINNYFGRFGFYPYKQLSIIPGNNFTKGGYANNNLIILHETLEQIKNKTEAENIIRWYLAYYIAQQYFGYYVGESGEMPKWISSGASLILANSYIREKNIPNNSFNEITEQYVKATRAYFNTQVLQPVDDLRLSNFDWENIIEKGKSAQIFKMLENMLGRKIMQNTLKDILAKYPNSMIGLDNFKKIIENISAKELDWFFDQWVNEDKKLDYAVTSIKQEKANDKYRVKIKLKKLGKAIMPVSLALTLKNNSKVFQIWDGSTSEAELTFEYLSPVKTVQIDPAGILPDVDRSNNQLNAIGL